MKELFILIKEMRRMQNEYDRSKSPPLLRKLRKVEYDIDKLIIKIEQEQIPQLSLAIF